MTARNQALVWIGVLAALAAALTLTGGILLPFVAGMAVAYFLDPFADRLEAWGTSRTVATIIITLIFFALLILALVLLVPLLQGQVLSFVEKLPQLVNSFLASIAPLQERVEGLISSDRLEQLRDAAQSSAGTLIAWAGGLLARIWQGGVAFFNLLSLVVITPIVSFYLLRDWDRIVERVDGWLPRRHAPAIREILADIDTTVAGFVRRQGTVCLFLAVFYGVGLTIVGLDFGLTIGLATGLISFVPYFGMLVGMGVAFGVAFAQFTEVLPFVFVFAVFMAGQAVESMFLTPKLVGDRVGLHPVWVIFALLAGGAIFGFTGVLLAVPAAATIGVLIRFFLRRYLESPLYGAGGDEAGEDPDA